MASPAANNSFDEDANEAGNGETNDVNEALVHGNVQLSLLYQLEQRKVRKLEEENRALRARMNALTSREDEARIELLVADRTRRKLIQLKAITKRTIYSLESSLKEFQLFVDDVEDAIEEQDLNGALPAAKVVENLNPGLLTAKFSPELKRIPESPMLPPPSPPAQAALFTPQPDLIPTTSKRSDSPVRAKEDQVNHFVERRKKRTTFVLPRKTDYEAAFDETITIFTGLEDTVIGQEQPDATLMNDSFDDPDSFTPSTLKRDETLASGNETFASSGNMTRKTADFEQTGYEADSDGNNTRDMTVDQTEVDRFAPEFTLSEHTITIDATVVLKTDEKENGGGSSEANARDTVVDQRGVTPFPLGTAPDEENLMSSGRSKRQATAKVTSYKLPPLNKKMRREK